MSITADCEEAVGRVVCERLSRRVRALLRWAYFDLWYGPHSAEDFDALETPDQDDQDQEGRYPGFHKACAEIAEALDELGTLYVEIESECVLDREPMGCWIDPETGEDVEECAEGAEWMDAPSYYQYSKRDIVKALGWKELAEYV